MAVNWPGDPLPSWVTSLRPQQIQAVNEIMDAYRRGVDVVVMDAPTGTGKTLIAELVRRKLGVKSSTYVAHSLSLQDQFLADFPYAKVLKGRTNYPTLLRKDLTAADCGGAKCGWCEPRGECPYLCARKAAVTAEVAVLNTSYMLSYRKPTFMRGLVVVDECDTLESVMKNHYEFFVGAKKLRQLGIKAPVKGARTPTVIRWLREDLEPAAVAEAVRLEEFYNELGADMAGQEEGLRKKMDAAKNLCERVELLAGQLEAGTVPWVREYGAAGDYIMRPVEVSSQGAEVLWERGKEKKTKWLAMSGTVIDAQEWVASTGVEAAGLTWDLVTVPMLWKKENRPIVTRTWGDMSKGGSEEGKQRVLRKCAEICKKHVDRGENVLVHSVSYGLMNQVCDELALVGIRAVKYAKASERDRALAKFKRQGGVIVAPSLDRGVDLPDDLCRVQVVLKMPFLHLGDRQVSERLNMPDGGVWYAVQTARTLVQMTGRGVRHKDDRCVTYILDRSFDKYYAKWARLLPRWWRDSIVGELPEEW